MKLYILSRELSQRVSFSASALYCLFAYMACGSTGKGFFFRSQINGHLIRLTPVALTSDVDDDDAA